MVSTADLPILKEPEGTGSVTDGRWRLAGVLGVPDELGGSGPFELVVRNGIIATLRSIDKRDEHERAASRLVLVPLLVNAHDHGRGTGNVLAGIADGPLEPWIASLRARKDTTSQVALVGDACRAMLASGVGATVICVNPQGPDTAAEVYAAAQAARDVGIRAAIVYPFADTMDQVYGRSRDAVGWDPTEVERHLESVERVAAGVEDGLIEVQLGPVGPQWVSESTLAAIAVSARRTGRRVHMHLLESPAQRAWADRTYPEGIVNFLDRIGLLGAHVCFAHGTQLRSDELASLADNGCVLSLNASSNLRLSSGIPPVAEAQRAGLDLGAGLDGMALGDDADYWNELRLLRGLGQAQTGQVIEAGPLFERLARGGRRALGSCAPKVPATDGVADFVLLDLGDYRHLVGRDDWSVADVALAAGRPEFVREVWVGGRAVLARAASPSTTTRAEPSGEVAS
ncbi:MAG: putative amidohydrolase [Acidimicrobiaceae bacterium]|nr:putative amidohydrolase [Acidimicrobiaceae bacterium]